jgi:hypothetical protein
VADLGFPRIPRYAVPQMLSLMQLGPLERPVRLGRLVRRASAAFGASPLAIVRRAFLLRKYGFHMEEAVPLGLLDPAFPESRFAEFVTSDRVTAVQRRLSPPALTAVIDDKVLFWVACRAVRIRTAPVRAVVRRARTGWTEAGATPRSRAEWATALARLADGELVAKPAHGDHGEGVRAFVVRDGRFFEHGRELGNGGALAASLLADRRYEDFLLQTRLENHELLTRLSGCRTLQTVRIWTLLEAVDADRPEDVTVLGGEMKLVWADTVTDNDSTIPGMRGFSLVDGETGVLGPLLRTRPDSLAPEALERHPRTGAVFEGVRLPLWDEALALVRRAAAAFPLLRTLGWDVALTPDGAVLIEANAGWGPPNEFGIAPALVERLEEALHAGGGAGRSQASRRPPDRVLTATRPGCQ